MKKTKEKISKIDKWYQNYSLIRMELQQDKTQQAINHVGGNSEQEIIGIQK